MSAGTQGEEMELNVTISARPMPTSDPSSTPMDPGLLGDSLAQTGIDPQLLLIIGVVLAIAGTILHRTLLKTRGELQDAARHRLGAEATSSTSNPASSAR